MGNMLQEIKTLVQTLNEQRDAYYNKDSPKMTDKEYDRLFDRLEELEKNQELSSLIRQRRVSVIIQSVN